MKIIRFLSDTEEMLYGVMSPERPASAAVIAGHIPGA